MKKSERSTSTPPITQLIPGIAIIIVGLVVIIGVLVSKYTSNNELGPELPLSEPDAVSPIAPDAGKSFSPTASNTDEPKQMDSSKRNESSETFTSQNDGEAAMVLLHDINMNPERALFTADAILVKSPDSTDGFDLANYPTLSSGALANEYQWGSSSPNEYCDIREAALYRDGVNVMVDPDNCEVLSGQWVDPFTGEIVNDPAQMVAVNVVTPKNAYSTGGKEWDESQRATFVNSPQNVVAASLTGASIRGDSSPDAWAPAGNASKCAYGVRWVEVKNMTGLNFTVEEASAVKSNLLGVCGSL